MDMSLARYAWFRFQKEEIVACIGLDSKLEWWVVDYRPGRRVFGYPKTYHRLLYGAGYLKAWGI